MSDRFWFNDGSGTYSAATADEARASAVAAIQFIRDELHGDEWPFYIDDISWGTYDSRGEQVTLGRATERITARHECAPGERESEDGCDCEVPAYHDYLAEYDIVDTQ